MAWCSTAATVLYLGEPRIRGVGIFPILHGFGQLGLTGKSRIWTRNTSGREVAGFDFMVLDDDCHEVKVDETFSHSEEQFPGSPQNIEPHTCLHGRYSGEFRYAGSFPRTRL
jgi:hypothetical protein